MRKKRIIKKRLIQEDSRFSSILVSQLISKLIKDGKKKKAAGITYKALGILNDPLLTLEQAVENTKPTWECKPRKIGSVKQRVPYEVKPERSLTLALRWLVKAAREKKNNKSMFENLAQEIIEAQQKKGIAFSKKKTIHEEAMKNMSLVNFRSRFR